MDRRRARKEANWEISQSLPSVAIITLNYFAVEATINCLRSIDELDYKGAIEVIVVDNGSTKETCQLLRNAIAGSNAKIRLFEMGKNLGFAGGVNYAHSLADSDLVCLINNDAEFHPECLGKLVEQLRRRTDLIASWPFVFDINERVKLKVPDKDQKPNIGNGTQNILGENIWLPLLKPFEKCFTPSGVCLLYIRNLTEQPFPNKYFAYYEDIFFGWSNRLRGLGTERVYDAVIYHSGGLASKGNMKRLYSRAVHIEKNRLANLFILYSLGTLGRIFPLLVISEALKGCVSLFSLIKKDGFIRAGSFLESRYWLAMNARWIFQYRRKTQSCRTVPDDEILGMMSCRFSDKSGWKAELVNKVFRLYCKLFRIRTIELVQD